MKINDGLLMCPHCDGTDTHVEQVFVSARREDALPNEITVNAVSGQVRTHEPQPGPKGSGVGIGRRQRVALGGSCEKCGGRFALVFTQHKGVTLVEVAEGELPLWPSEID